MGGNASNGTAETLAAGCAGYGQGCKDSVKIGIVIGRSMKGRCFSQEFLKYQLVTILESF